MPSCQTCCTPAQVRWKRRMTMAEQQSKAAVDEERRAVLGFIIDRAENYGGVSKDFCAELLGGLAEGRHIACARAGEYDDLEEQVSTLLAKRTEVTPLVRRASLRPVR